MFFDLFRDIFRIGYRSGNYGHRQNLLGIAIQLPAIRVQIRKPAQALQLLKRQKNICTALVDDGRIYLSPLSPMRT